MIRRLLITCIAIATGTAHAEIIRFSGTIDGYYQSPTLPTYQIAPTFVGTLDYDREATSDRWIVRNVSIYIGGDTFIRTTFDLLEGGQKLHGRPSAATE